MGRAVAHADARVADKSPTAHSVRFASMGNTAFVTVIADDDETGERLLERSRGWAASLEARWSRFIPTSDVSRLNTARGRAVRISPDTEVLIRHLLSAHDVTNGHFDPFVLPALLAAGYTTSFAGDARTSCPASAPESRSSRRNVVIESIDGSTWCRLLEGATLDPGGLGKGLAADIIAERLIMEGALGALVSMGGDIRCIGASPDPAGWVVDIEALSHPAMGASTVVLRSGAIATSSTFAKRWHAGHHVIDPTTGRPTDEASHDALRMSSVIASTAVWAEVFATACIVAGADRAAELVETHGLAARFERTNGIPVCTSNFGRYRS